MDKSQLPTQHKNLPRFSLSGCKECSREEKRKKFHSRPNYVGYNFAEDRLGTKYAIDFVTINAWKLKRHETISW